MECLRLFFDFLSFLFSLVLLSLVLISLFKSLKLFALNDFQKKEDLTKNIRLIKESFFVPSPGEIVNVKDQFLLEGFSFLFP